MRLLAKSRLPEGEIPFFGFAKGLIAQPRHQLRACSRRDFALPEAPIPPAAILPAAPKRTRQPSERATMSDANDAETLAKEVRYLRDRQDIADVISAYCRGLDRLDADILRGAYHEGALDRHGPFLGDRDNFVPWAIGLVAGFPLSHHSVTTHNCRIEGDMAWAESYCVFFTLTPDQQTLGAGAARYIDELERRDGKWAIAKRAEIMDCCYEVPVKHWLGGAWEEIPSRQDRDDLSYQRPLTLPDPILSE